MALLLGWFHSNDKFEASLIMLGAKKRSKKGVFAKRSINAFSCPLAAAADFAAAAVALIPFLSRGETDGSPPWMFPFQ